MRFGVLNRLLKPLNITTIYYLAVFIKLVLLAKHERGGERERLRGHHLRIAWGQAAEELQAASGTLASNARALQAEVDGFLARVRAG